MHVYCNKCRTQQKGNEKHCLNCGAKYGEGLWVLILGAFLVVFLPVLMIIGGANWSTTVTHKIVLLYELPVVCGTAFLYDYHPSRRNIYFWGGGILIVVSVLYFNR